MMLSTEQILRSCFLAKVMRSVEVQRGVDDAVEIAVGDHGAEKVPRHLARDDGEGLAS